MRELENYIEHAVLLSNSDTIEILHLPPSLYVREAKAEKKGRGKLSSVVEAQERSLIINTLEAKGEIKPKPRKCWELPNESFSIKLPSWESIQHFSVKRIKTPKKNNRL